MAENLGSLRVGSHTLQICSVWLDRGLIFMEASMSGPGPAERHSRYQIFGRDGALICEVRGGIDLQWPAFDVALSVTVTLSFTDQMAYGIGA